MAFYWELNWRSYYGESWLVLCTSAFLSPPKAISSLRAELSSESPIVQCLAPCPGLMVEPVWVWKGGGGGAVLGCQWGEAVGMGRAKDLSHPKS